MSDSLDFDSAWRRSADYLVDRANGAYSFLEAFRRQGFSAFDPGIALVESFAVTEAELSLHRACKIEWIKEQVSRFDLGTPAYHSVLLEEMRARRDAENGVPRQQLFDVYGTDGLWREKYEPCERRMQRFALDQPDTWKNRESRVEQERQERVEMEADQHASLSKEFSFPKDDRWPLYAKLMQAYAGPLGFFVAIERLFQACRLWKGDDARTKVALQRRKRPHVQMGLLSMEL